VPDNVNTGEAHNDSEGEAGGGLTLSRLVALRTQLDTLAARGLLAQVRESSSAVWTERESNNNPHLSEGSRLRVSESVPGNTVHR